MTHLVSTCKPTKAALQPGLKIGGDSYGNAIVCRNKTPYHKKICVALDLALREIQILVDVLIHLPWVILPSAGGGMNSNWENKKKDAEY